MQALKIAATGMSAQQLRVDVTSHNIANMSTTAFDPRRAEFSDLPYNQIRAPGTLTSLRGEEVPSGVQLGVGVRPSSVTLELKQGALRATGGEFDIAIEGGGFFEVLLPSGESSFTRDGAFKISGDGLIVSSIGYALADEITVPEGARAVEISPDGVVVARFDNRITAEEIGTINLTFFINPRGLEALGDNLFRETSASGTPLTGGPGSEGRGLLRQGYVEESSVNAVIEITELIEAQRAYELNARVMTAADEILSSIVRIK